MQEYRDVRKHHSLVEICKKPELAAEVTITAAEFLKVDAAIIFADLLLPLEVMGLPFHFSAGEGPVIEKPVRTRRRREGAAHRSRRRPRLCGRCGRPGGEAFRRQAAGDRLLRRALHAGQLHGRGRRVASLPGSEEADVQLARGLGRAGRQAGGRAGRIRRRAGARRRRRAADLRQLGRLPERGGLSPLRAGAHHAAHPASAERNARAHHLLRHRQRDVAAFDVGDRRGGHRPRLAHPARRRLAHGRTQARRAGQSRSGAAVCFVARAEAARRAHSPSRRRTARTHLQSRPRHSSAHAGGQREGPRAVCARVQLHRRNLARTQ